jgi:hypothetical protein
VDGGDALGGAAGVLRNRVTDTCGALAPLGYPALHHLAGPLRKAATAAGDTGLMHLWPRTGYRPAREKAAARALTHLAAHTCPSVNRSAIPRSNHLRERDQQRAAGTC